MGLVMYALQLSCCISNLLSGKIFAAFFCSYSMQTIYYSDLLLTNKYIKLKLIM